MNIKPSRSVILIAFVIRISCGNILLENHTKILNNTIYPYNIIFDTVLQKLDYLNLHLQQTNTSDHHAFVEYLLWQQYCPILLTADEVVGRGEGEGVIDFIENQRHKAITIISEWHLNIILNRNNNRAGYLFCILMNAINESHLLAMAEINWQERGIHKVYYITSYGVVFYNPFILRDSHQYGALVNARVTKFDEIFNNLNAYPIRVYIFNSVYSKVFGDSLTKQITQAIGPDSNIAKLLSKNMNFSLLLQWPDSDYFGTHLANGTYTGAIGRTIRYQTDITMTGFFVKDYLTRDIEFTFPMYMDELCCYVRNAKRIESSIAPLYAVKIDMWLGFLLAAVLCSFIWMILRWFNLNHSQKEIHTNLKKSQYTRIFTDTWILWLRINLKRFPTYQSERIFVLSLCLVSVIFGAIFESSLATIYIHPLYYKDINTLSELDNTNYRIYIRHAAIMDDLFRGHNSSVYANLNRKLFLVGETEERIIDIMIKRGGFAAVTRLSSTQLDDFPFFAKKNVHIIKECPKKYHIAFILPKASPFEKRINNLLLRYSQADLINHWIQMTQHQIRISAYNSLNSLLEPNHKWKILTINDLQLAFYILILGSILAILVWLAELLICKKFTNTN